MKKINKKYALGIVFFLAWFLTTFCAIPENNNLKLFIVTSIYYYIGIVIVAVVRIREQYQQLQTKTGDEYLVAKGNFENDLSLVALIATCTVVEIIYCCLHEFTGSSFLHGLVCTASFFPTIYFVTALVFKKRCKTLVNSTKSLAGIEMDKIVLRNFKPFEKSLMVTIILLNLFPIVGYFKTDSIEILLFVSVLIIMITFIFLNESKFRAKEALYKMEGTEKKFHIDVLSSLQESHSLIFFAIVFAAGSGFLVSLEAMASEVAVFLLVGVATIANLCFSTSDMNCVKLIYLTRELDETKKQEVKETTQN